MKIQLLGEAIKQRRLDLGLTQEEVCVGICDPATLSRVENGKLTPSHNRVRALLQRLNMPDSRYYALLNDQETQIQTARREIRSALTRFTRTAADRKKPLWLQITDQLDRLEALAEEDDNITRQFILSFRATLGREDGPYSFEEARSMLLAALRLTVPGFEPEDIGSRRYTQDETELINQIANTYSDAGEHDRALDIQRRLFEYMHKDGDQLSTYAPLFTLVAYNYARELSLCNYYGKSIEVAEEGKRVGISYGYYRFLSGFLAIMGESYYHLGETEKSKKACVQAHYLYEVLGDERNLRVIDPDIKARFNFEFPV